MFESLVEQAANASRRTRIIATLAVAYVPVVIWAIVADHVVSLVIISVLILGAGFLVKRVYTTHKVKQANIRAAMGRTRWPRLLAETLKPGESVEYETRMHPAFMIYAKRVAMFAAASAATFIASFMLGPGFVVLAIVSLLGAITTIAPRAINWWFTRWCFTDRRAIRVTGVFDKHVESVMLGRIQTVSHDKPFIDSVLKYVGFTGVWHWTFDTLVQKEPFNDVPWMLHPSPVGEILERHVDSAERDTLP